MRQKSALNFHPVFVQYGENKKNLTHPYKNAVLVFV